METDPTQLPRPDGALPRGIRLAIASPCHVKWDDMSGPGRVRHCALCDKKVYNLSQMTHDEVQRLLGPGKDLPCVQFYRRQDGSVMTADCPVGKPKRVVLKVVTSLGLAAGAALFGCDSRAAATAGEPCAATQAQQHGVTVLGKDVPYVVHTGGVASDPQPHPPHDRPLGGAPMPIEPDPPPPPPPPPPPRERRSRSR